MASLRDSVKDYQEELRDGIAWVAFWKEGRSWNAELFHLEVDGTLEPFDRSRLEEIKAADPAAVILNGYYCGHLGENMSLDELTAVVRYHYENSRNDLDGFIGAHDDRLPPEVIEEARAAAHAAGLPFSEKPYRDGEDFDPYSLFKQASDTVRSGVIIGLGSRLQVFQSELIKKITAKNEIDLELPGQQPCAYFLVTSDQDSTFDFLASLFLSFCFIKLVRYADHNCEGGKLPVPVHILGEELTACGTIPDLSRRLSVIRSRNISMSCVFQNLAGLQNRYPQNLWQEIIGNCDAQLFLGCTDQLTAEFISARTGLASVAVSSKSKQLGTWRISNYTPEFRETSGVGKRPVLTPDEVLRLPLDQALIIIRGKKVLQVDKMDYSKHPEAKYLRSCKASAHVPEWRRLEEEAAKTPQPAPKPAPAAKKQAKRKATKPASPTDKSPKEAPAPKSAGTPEGIITTDKDSILS